MDMKVIGGNSAQQETIHKFGKQIATRFNDQNYP